MALGSAVTKRGQDNSLQMCERCKYQGGVRGREAARRGAVLGPLWRRRGTCGVSRHRGGTFGRTGVQSKQRVPILGHSLQKIRKPSSKAHSLRLGTWGRGFKSHCVLQRPCFIGLTASSGFYLPTAVVCSTPRPPPPPPPFRSRPLPDSRGCRSSRPSPGGDGRRAAESPSAVEASGAAVCAEVTLPRSPGAEGMQMRQTRGGEPRSPEETGGRAPGRLDGCLPRRRERGAARGGRTLGAGQVCAAGAEDGAGVRADCGRWSPWWAHIHTPTPHTATFSAVGGRIAPRWKPN